MVCAAQLSLGDAQVIGGVPVDGARRGAGGIACDGEGLEGNGFEISLQGVSSSRAHADRREARTMACALVLQVLRNSIREGGSLGNAQVVVVLKVQSRTGAASLHQHRWLPSAAARGDGREGRRDGGREGRRGGGREGRRDWAEDVVMTWHALTRSTMVPEPRTRRMDGATQRAGAEQQRGAAGRGGGGGGAS